MSEKIERILVDIGHPAHVHFFRNAIRIWKEHGHSVVITIRDKDITAKLLDEYGLAYSIASKARKGFFGLSLELIEHDVGVLKAAVHHKSQILIGTSVSITHVAALLRATSVVFNEDDASVAKMFTRMAYPLASKIVTPTTLCEDYGARHIKYEGYQKLAYLHPNYFTPDASIKNKLGVRTDEPYFILRFISLKAAHDYKEHGMSVSLQRKVINFLEKYGKVFITSEGQLPPEFKKYQFNLNPTEIHHALYFAKAFIGDSQSMIVEAAILGVPSIRVNSFADRCSIIQELEKDYQLCYSFFPSQEKEIFDQVKKLLGDIKLTEKWKTKREKLLSDKIDVTAWIVDFVESLK